jgi:ATP-dependent Clp protease ATP-binding subunit ClpC
MFERFTERARQVIILAQEEARQLKHNYIGTEHLLLGILREEEGLGARALESLDITIERVRLKVTQMVGSGEDVVSGQIPFTPRAKKILELALRESLALGHNYIGTEHITLGFVRENEGVGARIVSDILELPPTQTAEKVRDAIVEMLGVSRDLDDGEEVTVELVKSAKAEMEQAIEDQEYDRAAKLRDRYRRLRDALAAIEGHLAEQKVDEADERWGVSIYGTEIQNDFTDMWESRPSINDGASGMLEVRGGVEEPVILVNPSMQFVVVRKGEF